MAPELRDEQWGTPELYVVVGMSLHTSHQEMKTFIHTTLKVVITFLPLVWAATLDFKQCSVHLAGQVGLEMYEMEM